MRTQSLRHAARQAGFTLIELVIVIIVIGILAAVAIPKLTDVTTSAGKAGNTAILAMTKSAWSAAYAVAKQNPTVAQIAAQTSDPTCTPGTNQLSCTTSWLAASSGGGQLLIDTGADPVTSTANMVCHNHTGDTADC